MISTYESIKNEGIIFQISLAFISKMQTSDNRVYTSGIVNKK